MATYEFIIKNNTATGQNNPISNNEETNIDSNELSPSEKFIIKSLVANNRYVKPFISNIINHRINTVEIRTGSKELQSKISFAADLISNTAQFGESLIEGYILGNLPGVFVSGILNVANYAFNVQNKRQIIGYNDSIEAISLSFSNIRSGGILPSYSGSRRFK